MSISRRRLVRVLLLLPFAGLFARSAVPALEPARGVLTVAKIREAKRIMDENMVGYPHVVRQGKLVATRFDKEIIAAFFDIPPSRHWRTLKRAGEMPPP